MAKDDVEAHLPLLVDKPAAGSQRAKFIALSIYFAINLSLSTFNKLILGKFNFPWTLTALHSTATLIGSLVLLWRGYFHVTKLDMKENVVLAIYSTLFTINIAISNLSLSMVSMPFHQIMRSTCPVFTVLTCRILYSKTYSTTVYLSFIPMVLGIGLATYGDYYFTLSGFLMTGLGVLLASAKTIATNRLMTGRLKLPPMELLLRMSPLAVVQSILYAGLTGELRIIYAQWMHAELPIKTLYALAGNSMLAFAQNVSSYQTNKMAGPVTMTVCANLKQCLAILLAIIMFNMKVKPLNGIGMAVTLMGVGLYSWAGLR